MAVEVLVLGAVSTNDRLHHELQVAARKMVRVAQEIERQDSEARDDWARTLYEAAEEAERKGTAIMRDALEMRVDSFPPRRHAGR